MEYTRFDLINMDTIEQAWDGDELKIDDGDTRVWLTSRGNRMYTVTILLRNLLTEDGFNNHAILITKNNNYG